MAGPESLGRQPLLPACQLIEKIAPPGLLICLRGFPADAGAGMLRRQWIYAADGPAKAPQKTSGLLGTLSVSPFALPWRDRTMAAVVLSLSPSPEGGDRLRTSVAEARRLLKPTGSLFVHLDHQEAHYARVMLDAFFGRESFMNEIICTHESGTPIWMRWSTTHDTILWYANDPEEYTFNLEALEQSPHMAPGPEDGGDQRRSRPPTDVWSPDHETGGGERGDYPNQIPFDVLNRIIKVHTNPGDRVLDLFATSGSLGEAAFRSGRSSVLLGNNAGAVDTMAEQLSFAKPRVLNAL